ncbi:kinase-like domain-containing protein [Glomus cerebriforme]|uniref:Kinase-like domain-containing protein n=1 Tax=Glomus cerebriforme TaxID=658196 RepID=A0A397SC84_9GLOM|nr:kinase-like domain-containing protein [Glomus cerebriforme]
MSEYYGITQDPTTQEILIIMLYYSSGDLINYLTNDFIILLIRDFHSGNIIFSGKYADTVIGDLGISKSATETTDDNENYGIIPYMSPEIFKGQKYTKASDIYSFGMIMWEFITGKRPFWDRIHDTQLIIEMCDGLRPPIFTNAPEGYIDLMKECWHSDLDKRPTATVIYVRIRNMSEDPKNFIKNIPSSDIGPITTNNPGAIYKSRPLSGMIRSAMSTMSTRNLISRSIFSEVDKRKFEDNQIENSFNEEISQPKVSRRLYYKELEFDIDMNLEQYNDENLEYFTQEFNFDI